MSFLDLNECNVCFERFDAVDRRPKFLECGHTACLRCVKGCLEDGRLTCPMDREVFDVADPAALKDNFQVLPSVGAPNVKRVTFWCTECDLEADDLCMMSHTVCSLRVARSKTIKGDLQVLKRDVDLHEELSGLLREFGSKVSASVHKYRTDLSVAKGTSEEALSKVNGSLEVAEPEWQVAKTDASKAAAAVAKRLLALEENRKLLQMGALCAVELRKPGENGESQPSIWRATAQLGGAETTEAEEAALRHMLFTLHDSGKLSREELCFRFSLNPLSVTTTPKSSPKYFFRDFILWMQCGRSEEHGQDYLEAYLSASNNKTCNEKWNFEVNFEIKLVSQKENATARCGRATRVFSSEDSIWGWQLVSWNELLDRNKGYMKEDKITFEVHVKTILK